jgi:hypothetical protein
MLPGQLPVVLRMYSDIQTMCWSIKEVNKNLTDRKQLTDYSIKYLKDSCSKLALMMKEMSNSRPDERIEVMNKKGESSECSLAEVAEALYDTKKIIELNLIDRISRWARAHADRDKAITS